MKAGLMTQHTSDPQYVYVVLKHSPGPPPIRTARFKDGEFYSYSTQELIPTTSILEVGKPTETPGKTYWRPLQQFLDDQR